MKEYTIAKNEQEWHELRSKGIGGSDVASVLGLNKYKSAFELWSEKTGLVQQEDLSHRIPILIGNELEDLVARIFTTETGLKVRKDNKTYKHKDYPFLLANIDRHILGQKAILECKTTSVYNADEWKDDEIPAGYLLQVQHYLDVLDYDTAYIAVIIGNHDFKFKKVERDDELIQQVRTKLIDFWENNVLKNIPPEIDGTPTSTKFLSQYYTDLAEDSVELSYEYINACELIQEYKTLIKEMQTRLKEQENKVKKFIGDNGVENATSQKFNVSWKLQSRNSIDTDRLKKEFPDVYKDVLKTTQNRVFRLKEFKS